MDGLQGASDKPVSAGLLPFTLAQATALCSKSHS